MNKLESSTIANPFGKEEECAKFTIDDTQNDFVLSQLMTIRRQYTFSCWVKSDAAGSVTVAGKTVQTTAEWERVEVTFTAAAEEFFFDFGSVGVYYFYHPQLEIGNKSTDWMQAPEDVDKSIADTAEGLNRAITEQGASIVATKSEILQTVSETYVTYTEHGELKTSLESQISETAKGLTIDIERVDKRVNGVEEEVNAVTKRVEVTESGVVISTPGSAKSITLQLDNEAGIIFSKNGTPFGRWDGDFFETGNIRIRTNERAQFGNFAFIPRSDGSLSFKKVGG